MEPHGRFRFSSSLLHFGKPVKDICAKKKEVDGIYYASIIALFMAFFSSHIFDNFVHSRCLLCWIPNFSFSHTKQGFTFLGGFLGGLISYVIYLKILNISVLRACNMAAPSLSFGHSIGRIGCFLAGCCYGKKVSLYHVEFNIPTQLIESLLLILISYLLLYRLSFNTRFAFYLISYGTGRFLLEFTRGDPRGELFEVILSPSQTISICMIILGIMIIFNLKNINYFSNNNNIL